jgi:hypothetical protein
VGSCLGRRSGGGGSHHSFHGLWRPSIHGPWTYCRPALPSLGLIDRMLRLARMPLLDLTLDPDTSDSFLPLSRPEITLSKHSGRLLQTEEIPPPALELQAQRGLPGEVLSSGNLVAGNRDCKAFWTKWGPERPTSCG